MKKQDESVTNKKKKSVFNWMNLIIIIVFFVFIKVVAYFADFSDTANDSLQNNQSNQSLISSNIAPLDESFEINFPGKPEEDSMELNGVKIKQYSYVDDDAIYFIKVGKFDSETETLFRTKPEAVDVFFSKFPNNLFTIEEKDPQVILAEKKIFFDNYPGVEYEYKANINSIELHKKGLIFMRNGETLQLSVTYPTGFSEAMESKYMGFKSSLKLTK